MNQSSPNDENAIQNQRPRKKADDRLNNLQLQPIPALTCNSPLSRTAHHV